MKKMATQKKGCSFKTFLYCKPPEFGESTDPKTSLRWLMSMEHFFDCCECDEEQKVKYAVRVLKGNPSDWWETVRNSTGEAIADHMSWEGFKAEFKGYYCTKQDMFNLEEDFLNLKKGEMTIEQYADLFKEKLCFAIRLVPDEESKVNSFLMGLPSSYRPFVQKMTTLNAAIEEAKMVEDVLVLKQEDERVAGEKRRWEGPIGSSKKFNKTCFRCGKMGHVSRNCTSKEKVCYNCREMGHISANCPTI